MESNIQRNGLINLLVLLAVGIAGFAVARSANSLAGQVSVVFISVGVLVSAMSWFQMRLEDRERLERFEIEELTKTRGDTALFKEKSAEIFPAQRSREQFERFFVPIFTILLCLAQGGAAWYFWHWFSQTTTSIELRDATMPMFLFFVFALVLFMLGKFSTTIARLENHRLLRPGAGYLLLGAYLCTVVALGIIGVQAGFKKADFYVGCFLCVLLGLVAVETLIQLVLEIYRPRSKGKAPRPLYESRLVGLLSQPEGLVTTAAQALDYQFGFKVSETWFYRFFEQALGILILLQLGALILSTCFVFIDAGEQGLLERFGRPVSGRGLLEPGAHVKLPWPIDKVYRFRTEQIQNFTVGLAPDADKENEPVVLWTVAHRKEDNFLVANREPAAASTNATENAVKRPPVSLITGTIPIQFQITNLLSWAYNNEDSPSLLEDLATREVVRYFVGADMNEILSHGRGGASRDLQARIQSAADEHTLGAKIISVGLHDLHPPVKVAPDYEKVVSAIHTKQAKILSAQADAIRTNALAEAQATSIINEAKSDALSREISALAQAALFTNQIPAYQAAPSVYSQRAYLQTFARSTANARKYILLTTNTHDVIQFDLQDRIRQDILQDITIKPAK